MRWIPLVACVLGCGEVAPPPTTHDAGVFGIKVPDASSPRPDAGARLETHGGVILSSLRVGIVYVGDVGDGGAPTADAGVASAILGSSYWNLLGEYGIDAGEVVGSVRIATSDLLAPGDVDGSGLVDLLVLHARIAQIVDGDDPGVSIAGANAHLVFLPDGVNVALGTRGSYVYRTCVDAYAYHAYDGFAPYAVFPPCDEGRSSYAISHELAEMATDPQPFRGSATDSEKEAASTCNEKIEYAGMVVARLWSNGAAACKP